MLISEELVTCDVKQNTPNYLHCTQAYTHTDKHTHSLTHTLDAQPQFFMRINVNFYE